jgi:hypothetical protein
MGACSCHLTRLFSCCSSQFYTQLSSPEISILSRNSNHLTTMAADCVPGAAAVACVSCRRLKVCPASSNHKWMDRCLTNLQMRCIGASNPPCVRCLKNNRECVVQPPNRKQRHLPRFNAPSYPPAPPSPDPVVETTPPLGASHAYTSPAIRIEAASQLQEPYPRLVSEQQNPLLNQTNMPSIFSLSPITIASTKASESEGPSNITPASHVQLELDQVSRSTISDLVEL